MAKLLDLLNEFSKDPSKIESLPDIINEATLMQQSEINSQALLEKAQSSNRSLLSQIVVQPDPTQEEVKEISTKDITDSLINEMNGGKNNG